ncbi:MAG: chorismate mutase, partial [Bacteriovoracaceae bacterium]
MDITPLNKWIPNLKKPLVIAGPCSAETREQCLSIAQDIVKNEDVRIFR